VGFANVMLSFCAMLQTTSMSAGIVLISLFVLLSLIVAVGAMVQWGIAATEGLLWCTVSVRHYPAREWDSPLSEKE